MTESNHTDAGQAAAQGSTDTQQPMTGGSVQDSHNQAMAPSATEAAAAAQQAAFDSEAENIDALIAELELDPGDTAPVSIDTRTGKVEPVGAPKPAQDTLSNIDPEFANPMRETKAPVPAPQAQHQTPAPAQPAPQNPDNQDTDDEEEGSKEFPQHRFRPSSPEADYMTRLLKARVPVAEAIELVTKKFPVNQPASQPTGETNALPDINELVTKQATLTREMEDLEAQIDAAEASMETAEESFDFDAASQKRKEVKDLRTKLRESRTALKALGDVHGKAREAQNEAQVRFQAQWDAYEQEAATKYAADGYGNPESPLAKAAAEAHQLLFEQGDPRLERADYPKVYWARAKEFLRANPGLYGAATPAPVVSQAVPSQVSQPQPPILTMQPARGNVPPAPAGPSRLDELLASADNSSDLNDLIRSL